LCNLYLCVGVVEILNLQLEYKFGRGSYTHEEQEGCIMLHFLVKAHSFMSAYAVAKQT